MRVLLEAYHSVLLAATVSLAQLRTTTLASADSRQKIASLLLVMKRVMFGYWIPAGTSPRFTYRFLSMVTLSLILIFPKMTTCWPQLPVIKPVEWSM